MPSGVKVGANGGCGFSGGVAGKGFLHQRGGERVQHPLFLFNFVPQRDGSAESLSLQGAFPVSPLDLLLQILGVVFVQPLQHGLQQPSLGAVGDVLRSGDHHAAVFDQDGPGGGAVLPVPGKAVQFPDQNGVPVGPFTVGKHLLEGCPLVHAGVGGDGPVYIDGRDTVAVLQTVGNQRPELALDGLFRLPLGRVPHVQTAGLRAVVGEHTGVLRKLAALLRGESR